MHGVTTKTFSFVLDFKLSQCFEILNVVFFLLGNSPVSEFYMPTFRNALVCFILIGCVNRRTILPTYTAYEEGKDRAFRNVGI